jgi:solute carrier family 25 protein 33/36
MATETKAGSAKSFAEHFVAGALGGSLAAALLCPLDVLRTRMQSTLPPRLSPILLFKHIIAHEGPLALYRGLVPTIMGVGPSRALYFGTYGTLKAWLSRDSVQLSGAPLHLLAAALSGIATNTVMSPWWVIRLRVQLQNAPVQSFWQRWREPAPQIVTFGAPQQYRGIVGTATRIYREEGFFAFYRGLTASYLGVTETALQFMLYGYLKDTLLARRQAENGAGAAASHGSEAGRPVFSGLDAMLAGAASKLVASAVTYPHEVIRTRMREKPSAGAPSRYSSIVRTAVTIAKEEGVRGLYGGLSVHLLRTVSTCLAGSRFLSFKASVTVHYEQVIRSRCTFAGSKCRYFAFCSRRSFGRIRLKALFS